MNPEFETELALEYIDHFGDNLMGQYFFNRLVERFNKMLFRDMLLEVK